MHDHESKSSPKTLVRHVELHSEYRFFVNFLYRQEPDFGEIGASYMIPGIGGYKVTHQFLVFALFHRKVHPCLSIASSWSRGLLKKLLCNPGQRFSFWAREMRGSMPGRSCTFEHLVCQKLCYTLCIYIIYKHYICICEGLRMRTGSWCLTMDVLKCTLISHIQRNNVVSKKCFKNPRVWTDCRFNCTGFI